MDMEMRGCTNTVLRVAMAITFCTVAPNICAYEVWNCLRVTLLVLKILRWLLIFLYIYIYIICAREVNVKCSGSRKDG
jgi:hypothetical protein